MWCLLAGVGLARLSPIVGSMLLLWLELAVAVAVAVSALSGLSGLSAEVARSSADSSS